MFSDVKPIAYAVWNGFAGQREHFLCPGEHWQQQKSRLLKRRLLFSSRTLSKYHGVTVKVAALPT
ncbi:MAG: hypothetical protein WAO04_10355, partial [Candidatus Sulfotelmatobacter sp.]